MEFALRKIIPMDSERIYFRKIQYVKKDENTFRFKFELENKQRALVKLLITQIDLNDPADIWTKDGSLNTLSDRPGMDSQKTNGFGIKLFMHLEILNSKSLTNITDTDVGTKLL